MSMIFGSQDDRLKKEGFMSFYERDGNDDRIFHSGNMAFSNNGRLYGESEGTSFFNDNVINRCGDTYFSGGKRYWRSGSTLFCSDGRRWYGDMSGEDIRDIISHDF